MKPIRVAEDLIPVGRFKGQATRWLRRAADTGHPIVITVNGTPAGVLVSPGEYDRLAYRERRLASLDVGLADLDCGRTLDTAELKRRLARGRSIRPR